MTEIATLRRLVDDLATRVIAIEEGFVVDHERYCRLGFTRCEAVIVALLMKRGTVSRNAAMTVLYGAAPDDPPDDKIVDIFMCRIRKRLALWGLRLATTRHVGWELAPATQAAIRRRLATIEAAQ